MELPFMSLFPRALALSLSVLGGLSGAGLPILQAKAHDLRSIVNEIAQSAANSGSVPGLIVGISSHGVRHYYTYSGTGETAPAPRDTIVEIGSITKVFTTALFAEAIQAGQMAPSASIASYLPGISLQACATQATPLELADFSSGMPDEPPGLAANPRLRDIHHFTANDFMNWVSRWTPDSGYGCVLPAPYVYSNAGIGVLGIMLAKVAGQPWPQLLNQEITGPLHMIDTTMTVAQANRGRLEQGYTSAGDRAIPWPIYAWYPAGALRSTTQDMLSFGEAALGHTTANGAVPPPALVAAFGSAMTPIYPIPGRPGRQAMAWVVTADGIAFKDGGTQGFNSVIVIDVAKDLAIFAVANKTSVAMPPLGLAIARAIP
jgi:CubicO group peptidase (beta-lactamase class C family)